MNWFKKLWNRLVRIFDKFVDIALPIVTKMLIAEFKDAAINIVGTLQKTKLTNTAKRDKAFEDIKAEASKRGKNLSDSLVSLLIELALQFIKNSIV